MYYLADHVDDGRLPEAAGSLCRSRSRIAHVAANVCALASARLLIRMSDFSARSVMRS
jgi:hypothetical protein